VSYPALKGEASWLIAPPCPTGRGQSSTGTKGGSHPERCEKCPLMGLLDGAEAYLTDPHFNRGVSVTLTPSATAIREILAKRYLNMRGLSIPAS